MTASRLLYLNTHRLSAYAWKQGRLALEGTFENNEIGHAGFRVYLDKQGRSIFWMLANVAEEGHVQEVIPYLRGKDRETLIGRKIGQHFLGTPLAAAFSIGFEKNRRKNERLLLSALTNPAHFEPWLKRINEVGTALAGIYTVAQMSGQLLGKLGHADSRCLLLTLQDHSIRESYLVNGRTLFSRMAPLTDSSIAGVASSFAAEAGKLYQYLVGQRLISRDETIPTYIVAAPTALPAIQRAVPEHGPLDFRLIDSQAAATRIGLHTQPEDSRSEQLFLHLLASAPPKQQFASENHRHDYRLAQIRQALLAVGLVSLLGGLLFAAKQAYEAYALREETQALKASEADFNQRYQEISATFPQLGIDNDTLRQLTDRHREITRQQRQPWNAFRQVSQALDRMPGVILESIDWRIGRATPTTGTQLNGNEEITSIHGSLRFDPNATPRQVLALIEEFADLLHTDTDCTVNIVQRPVDLESGRSLRGGDNEDNTRRARPFAVEIVRKIAP